MFGRPNRALAARARRRGPARVAALTFPPLIEDGKAVASRAHRPGPFTPPAANGRRRGQFPTALRRDTFGLDLDARPTRADVRRALDRPGPQVAGAVRGPPLSRRRRGRHQRFVVSAGFRHAEDGAGWPAWHRDPRDVHRGPPARSPFACRRRRGGARGGSRSWRCFATCSTEDRCSGSARSGSITTRWVRCSWATRARRRAPPGPYGGAMIRRIRAVSLASKYRMNPSLEALRPALLRLHGILLQAERRERENNLGPIPNQVWFGAALGDPELAWLRPASKLVSAIDEAAGGGAPHRRGAGAGGHRGLARRRPGSSSRPARATSNCCRRTRRSCSRTATSCVRCPRARRSP